MHIQSLLRPSNLRIYGQRGQCDDVHCCGSGQFISTTVTRLVITVSDPFLVDVGGLETVGFYSIAGTGPSGAEKVLVIFG